MKSEGAPLVLWRIIPLILFLSASTTLHAQPTITLAEAATMTPADPSSLPRNGTYWVYEENVKFLVPLPMNPFPTDTVNVYSLGEPGQFFIGATSNDWVTLLSQPPAQPMAARAMAAMATATTFPPLPAPYGDLTLVDNPPLVGTFWSLSNTNWPPLPYDYCPSCGIYSLPDGNFLVDDRSTPAPSPMFAQHFPPANTNLYSTNLWLHLDWMTNNTLGVTAWNTQPGELYNILSKTSLQSSSWTIETQITGASNQTRTSFQLDTQFRSAWFLWATNTDTVLSPNAWPSNSLHLELIGIHTSSPVLRVHGTGPNYSIQVMSKTNLADSWAPYGLPLWDTTAQGWVDVPLQMGAGTNSLFFWAYSPDYSSDGGEVPDWYELQYFQTTGLNPMTSYSGDGLSLVYKYDHRLDARQFSTPPGPTGLAAHLNADGTVSVSWNPVPGPATSYTVERYIPQLNKTDDFTVLPGTVTSFTDTTYSLTGPYYLGYDPTTYRVQARFSKGYSTWTTPVPVYQFDGDLAYNTLILHGTNTAAALVRGPLGAPYLAISALPGSAATVRLVGQYLSWDLSGPDPVSTVHSTNWDLPAPVFTNGLFQMSVSIATTWAESGGGGGLDSGCFVQLLDSDGKPISTIPVQSFYFDPTPFYDGREQLKENLEFLLRAADTVAPFGFTLQSVPDGTMTNDINYSYPSDYAYSGLYNLNEYGGLYYAIPDSFNAYRINNLYRNFVFSLADVDTNGDFTNGLSIQNYEVDLPYPPPYLFRTNSFTPLLDQGDSLWTWNALACTYQYDGSSAVADIGITNLADNGGEFAMLSGATNIFGLPFISTKVGYNPGPEQWTTLMPGYALTPSVTYAVNHMYGQTAQPTLQTVGYYFARPQDDYSWLVNKDLLPGHSTFSPITNTTPLLIFPFGQPFRIAGYAKQRILYGDPSKYAFLGQYFDKAYIVNADGTTNETGILSEYGEFLSTEPGTIILTTKPDLSQTNNLQGACTVHVIKLQLDVNHDGVMDLTYGGPDNTSFYNPFEFWINNDYDRSIPDSDDATNYDDSATPAQAKNIPDCNYTNALGTRAIPTQRDLEDFARLWLVGASNAFRLLPLGSKVTLDWGDVGNPNTNNPTIDLFEAADLDGGIGYLTNETIADLQTNSPQLAYIGRLGPGESLQLNYGGFVQFLESEHYIFCGVASGRGKLTLTIVDNHSNTLVQTSAYIHLQDIKQMYERWTVGDDPSIHPTNVASIATEDTDSFFQFPTNPSTTSYILYAHGWNMTRYDKDRFAESAFKRLYWQGYQGRFGVFRWPTDYGFAGDIFGSWSNPLTDPHNFDNSEFMAWQSAAGLLNKLKDLNAEYPGHVYLLAHSMGNVVSGEALRLAAQQGVGQIVNTYIASQGAIPAHVYDSTSTNLIDFTHTNPKIPSWVINLRGGTWGPDTPNIYSNRLAGNSAAVKRRINFFNFNDYALSPDAWCFNQEWKPDLFIGGSYSYMGSTNDPAPWNNFLFNPIGSSPVDLDIVNSQQDLYEAMAFAAESRSKALGATPDVRTLTSVLDLTTKWPPDTTGHNYRDHFWHSAEFRGDCWHEWDYWNTLLFSSQSGFNIGN
jgi:hypothetical protein